MSENREYVSRSDELGNIHISGEVLASIAAAAALEVEGVSGLSANLGSDIAELLSNKKNLTKGVHIQVEDEQVTVEPVSYTHLDVYKRQVLSVCFKITFLFSKTSPVFQAGTGKTL